MEHSKFHSNIIIICDYIIISENKYYYHCQKLIIPSFIIQNPIMKHHNIISLGCTVSLLDCKVGIIIKILS